MKRLLTFFLAITLSLIMARGALAVDWTVTPTLVATAGHYSCWRIVLTSNGSALTAESITVPSNVKGATLMVMSVVPGTSGVIPNGTIDITIADAYITLWADTAISKDAQSNHNLSADLTQFPTLFGDLVLTVNDIGDAGDQITLYFLIWEE